MSDEQYGQIIRWFETLNAKFVTFDSRLQRVEAEVHEVRELMAPAIANLDRRMDSVEVTE